MLKTLLTRILLVSLIIVSFSSTLIVNPKKAKAFDYNYLASDGGFININGMTTGQIQDLLISNGSFLKDFSENGRSAAQIIYDAAHGYGDASGTWNGIVIDTNTGTINPIAILATIQKEEGIVTGYYSQIEHYNQVRVDWAMGYGVCDSCSLDDPNVIKYKGFTKQIEWGSWQLRYNYERAAGHGFSDYQVGQTQIIDDVAITFSNRATAALYRYTPHLGTNFTTYFDMWGGNSGVYAYNYLSQTAHPTILPGQSTTLTLRIQNAGVATWTQNTVRLGTSRPQDRPSIFALGAGWYTQNRIIMQESSVAPGQTATFTFNVTAPASLGPGTYREYFRPVADGIMWMFDYGIYWDITVPSSQQMFQYSHFAQSANPTVNQGASTTLILRLKNTGYVTWTPAIVHLGTNRPQDRIPIFIRGAGWSSGNRIRMQDLSVPPGGIGTFTFTITVPEGLAPGTYREYFRPVADGYTWMNDIGIYWDITVPSSQQMFQYSHFAQSANPVVNQGASTTLTLRLTNTGYVAWTPAIVHLGTNRPQDRAPVFIRGDGWISSNRIRIQDSVAPGGIGTFTFTITVPEGLAPGTYREYFRPVADGYTWMNDIGIYWDINVQ